MCRFAAYIGEPILLDELLYRPKNSLILQSYKAKEREEPLNGDGFGLGWYAPDVSTEPVVFRSITPAWSNLNLQNIAKKTASGCFFAHVRAATHNNPVLEVNCHPFTFGSLLWMHNGHVGGFPFLKRKIVNLMSEERYMGIQGSTDTEHVFSLFLDRLSNPTEGAHPFEMKSALLETLAILKKLSVDNKITENSYLNICVTNGSEILVLRHVSNPSKKPHSLYWSQEGKYVVGADGQPALIDTVSSDRGIIVSSERLTEREKDWNAVPPNHMALIDHNLSVELEPVPAL
ncbi:MAG: class II glutamine amidotransferase [Ignavibacteriales bacterium]|nr:class II glutamine amidotransferase [Ignavibacteriales bacterium]